MTAVLEARSVLKRYGGLVALRDGRFSLERGEVHALLGSNGCGKSTLCKILAGAVAFDGGELTLFGRATRFRGPADARAAGIATVYQEMSLAPTLTVGENVLLGQEPRNRAGLADRPSMRHAVLDLIDSVGALGVGLHPDARVAELSIDKRQIVEILKALSIAPRVVFFDESTSSLDKSQVAAFFAQVRRLKELGTSCVFISHRMDEIFEIADRVTVMRNGAWVATKPTSESTRAEIVSLMVGGAAPAANAATAHGDSGEPRLSVSGLTSRRLHGIGFNVRAGELLGLGGLHGQGQSDLLQTLFAAQPATSGEVLLDGSPLALRGPLAAVRQGLAYVSGDRGHHGVLPGRPILENMALTSLAKGRSPLAHRGRLQRELGRLGADLKLKFGGFDDAIETLSGGNQQKVILGRALATNPRVLLLDDPTKGIDIQAKRDLFARIDELRRAGTAVILYSSEDAELLENASRILVFNSGRITEELHADRINEFNLYAAALATAH
jgi:ribose transport system ATP-binding protein